MSSDQNREVNYYPSPEWQAKYCVILSHIMSLAKSKSMLPQKWVLTWVEWPHAHSNSCLQVNTLLQLWRANIIIYLHCLILNIVIILYFI